MIRTATCILLLIFFSACEKEEGTGGKASIGGTLIMNEYNRDFSLLLSQHPARDKDIYISYGDQEVIGDDIETSYNGKFKFPFLQPGNYRLWYYSDDTIPGSQSEIVIEREIQLSKNQNKTLDNLFTYKIKDFDDGSGSICGKVYLINYKNTAEPPYREADIKDITPAQKEDVFLIYNDNQTFDEDVETNYEGTFCFTNLIRGKYRIYVYSEDLPGGEYDFNSDNVIRDPNSKGTPDLVLYQDIEITTRGEKIQLDDFYIEQE